MQSLYGQKDLGQRPWSQFESSPLRQYPVAKSQTALMSVEIPFGFKRVCVGNADFRDCARARIPSLKGFRLTPTGPHRNQSAFKISCNISGLEFQRMRTVGVGSLALGLVKTGGTPGGSVFCSAQDHADYDDIKGSWVWSQVVSPLVGRSMVTKPLSSAPLRAL